VKIEKAAPKPTTTKYPTALLRGGSSPKKLSRPEYFSGCECEIMLTLIYEIHGGNVFFEKLIICGFNGGCVLRSFKIGGCIYRPLKLVSQ
jgi:hypothetical protein